MTRSSKINVKNIDATGTRDATTALHGDATWKVVSGSGDMLLGTIQTVTAAKIFVDDALLVQNPGETFEYTIQAAAISADRILNLPLITAADTLVVLGLAQTFTAINKFTSASDRTLEVERTVTTDSTVQFPLAVRTESTISPTTGYGVGIHFLDDNSVGLGPVGRLSFIRGSNDNYGFRLDAVDTSNPRTLLEITQATATFATYDFHMLGAGSGNVSNFSIDMDDTNNTVLNLTDTHIKSTAAIATTKLADSANFVLKDTAQEYDDGIKLTFNPDGTSAGVNVGSQAGDPSTTINGDIWYNSSTGKWRVKEGGSDVDLIGAGSGDMILSSIQTVTGAKTFGTSGGAVGKFILAGSTSGTSIVNAAAVAGTTTITMPGSTDTLVGKATTDVLINKSIDEDGTGNAITNIDVASIKSGSSLITSAITIVIDGGGSAITTGVKVDITIPFGATITEVTMLADQSGSIVVDIFKDTFANYPPVVGDSITASAKPTITTALKSQDGTLTGWTTAITAGDTLRYNVDSVTSITRLTLSLKITRT
jgi:hypothetical protein